MQKAGCTALWYACEDNLDDAAVALVEAGASYHFRKVDTILHIKNTAPHGIDRKLLHIFFCIELRREAYQIYSGSGESYLNREKRLYEAVAKIDEVG